MTLPVVILAGGQASRLHSFRTVVPKPLMPVGDRAALDLVLRHVANHGFTDVTLAVGDLAPLIHALFGTGEGLGLSIRYSQEHEALGTAGVLGLLELDEPFVVMNGNILTTLDLGALVAAHAASGDTVTVAAHRRSVIADYGVLELSEDADGTLVTAYREKPATSHAVSMGVYVMEPEARDVIATGERLGLPELIERLVARGDRVGAYRFDGLWLDLRRREDYEAAVARYDEILPLFSEVSAGRTAA
jgi:NDP-sugar pyrophosphorylase family protein